MLPVFATMLAIERIGAGRTSMAAMVGPVATIGLASVFLGEPFRLATRRHGAGTRRRVRADAAGNGEGGSGLNSKEAS